MPMVDFFFIEEKNATILKFGAFDFTTRMITGILYYYANRVDMATKNTMQLLGARSSLYTAHDMM